MKLLALFKRFFSLNRDLCNRTEAVLNKGKINFADSYNLWCMRYIANYPKLTVLDVGTGKRLTYGNLLNRDISSHIIGCDVSKDEMDCNNDIHASIICDASQQIDLPDVSIDFITSHYCIEHLPTTDKFISECYRILRPGGRVCFIFAGGYSLHAILNKLLPHSISQKLLYFFLPGSEKHAGFKAYYDKGTLSAFSALMAENGFNVEQVECSYGSRGYFKFFYPCYLSIVLLDILLFKINCREFAADYIFIAQKPSLMTNGTSNVVADSNLVSF